MSFYTDKNETILCIYKTFTVPCENSQTVSFAFSIIKNIVVFPSLSKFSELLLDQHLMLAVNLNLLQSFYNFL